MPKGLSVTFLGSPYHLVIFLVVSCGSPHGQQHSSIPSTASAGRMTYGGLTFEDATQDLPNELDALFQDDRLALTDVSGGSYSDNQRAVMKYIQKIPPLRVPEGAREGRLALCESGVPRSAKGLCEKEETVETEEGTFICSSQKYELAKIPDSFVAINPNADALWPGALVQSKSLASGVLDPVPISDRSAGDITMAIATGSQGMFSATLEKPSLANTTEAIKGILNNSVSISTPAKFFYKMNRIYSKEQLAIAVGVKVDTPANFDISTSLNFESEDESNRILLEFTQEYYTIAFSPHNGIRGFFPEKVEVADLQPYTQEGNPMGYISTVTYGRKIYILFSSKAKMADLEAALAASFQANGVSVEVDVSVAHKTILNASKMHAYMIGGNAEDALDAMTSEGTNGNAIINIKKLLISGANFSKGNAGVPVSFTVRHLKDSSQVKVQISTEYTARECYPKNENREPPIWDLKITLDQVAIDKVGRFCEPPFNESGEFSVCLNLQVGATGAPVGVFCSAEQRKAKAGQKMVYGDANHSLVIPVVQRPGQQLFVSGFVHEHDMDDKIEEILDFRTNVELSKNYEWIDFKRHVAVSGVYDGCKATLQYSMEWLNQRS